MSAYLFSEPQILEFQQNGLVVLATLYIRSKIRPGNIWKSLTSSVNLHYSPTENPIVADYDDHEYRRAWGWKIKNDRDLLQGAARF